MPHVVENLFTRALQKLFVAPLLWQLKKFGCHPKNSDDKMGTKNFQSPHLVPFQLPQGWVTKKFGWPFLWQPKNFNHHSTHPHTVRWQTKFVGH